MAGAHLAAVNAKILREHIAAFEIPYDAKAAALNCHPLLSRDHISVVENTTNAGLDDVVFQTSSHPLWLHIGCSDVKVCPRLGWTILDALETQGVHIVASAMNLSAVPDVSVEKLYSSHTLEHLSYNLKTGVHSGML